MNRKVTKTSIKCFAIFLMFGFFAHLGIAQSQTIQGRVTDHQALPLPGVSVLVKGSTIGTITNVEGEYTLSSPQALSANDSLVFSYIGFKSAIVPVAGRSTIDVRLQEDQKVLNEVIVTALGIKREERALGYAAQAVQGDQITNARSNNAVSALSGKVAGLNLFSPGSGPVNSLRVSLRGDNSLIAGKNDALIVLDGVPLSSEITSSGVGNAYGAGSGNDVPVDFGNTIADINPNDIESITVLKGASAAALYGSRAANGVLIITTKSGARQQKGIGVTVNTNVSFNDVLRWPDRQYEYGQGTGRGFNDEGEMYYSYGVSEDGASTGGTSSAFGPRFEGQYYYQYDPETEGQSAERVLWRPYKDNVSGFFRTGSTITNNVAIEGGNEHGSARASVSRTRNKWIMPNTGFERISAALSLRQDISPKLNITGKANYTNRKSDNLPATGYNNQSIAYFMIFQNPNIPLEAYKKRWKSGMEQIEQIHPFSSFIDNPYLIAYEMTNAVNNHTTVGNIAATYQFSPKVNLMVRSGLAMVQETREQRRPYSTANFQQGYYKEQDVTNYEVNSDMLLTYNEKLGQNFSMTTSVGGNIMKSRHRLIEGEVEGLVIPGVFKLSNGINNPMMSTKEYNKQRNSLYAMFAVSYQDKIFIDITGRNDWSSTLPVQNNSFFYPSISSSFILSDLLALPQLISYAKLRLSAAQVGNDTDPYKTKKYYGESDFPGSGSVPTTLHNVDFKPEITTSYETGLEMIFLNRRLGFDLTLYRSFTKNQIVDVPLDPTTGYSRAVLNSGEVRNQGIELAVNGRPVDGQLSWNATVTWAKNNNKLLSLAEGVNEMQVIGYGGNATIAAKVGGTTGDIYGYGFLRAPDGQIIYDANGLPARPDETQYIGNAYADWKGGFLNEFAYKNFAFSFLIDGQYGGIVYSQTHHKMSEQGKLKHTLYGRKEGYIIGEGVVDNGDGTFSPNTTQVIPADFHKEYYRRANVESNSFDASYVKLREVRLGYTLPHQFLARTRLFQQASIALYGRDLAMITNFPMYDPETAALNGGVILPGVEMGQMPSTRTFGVDITLKF